MTNLKTESKQGINNEDQARYYSEIIPEPSYVAEASIISWGNSQGIRISRAVMEQMKVNVNDKVEMRVINSTLCIRKSCQNKNLKERLESFYNKPIDEIFVESTEEDWGTPKGKEIW